MPCINSTLILMGKLGGTNSQPYVVTFVQSLFWKNRKMNISSDSFFDDTIVMLGTFYTIINFLGSIGYIIIMK